MAWRGTHNAQIALWVPDRDSFKIELTAAVNQLAASGVGLAREAKPTFAAALGSCQTGTKGIAALVERAVPARWSFLGSFF
jgi:hypothetical protein